MASAAPLRMERAGWPSNRGEIHAAHARLRGERERTARAAFGDFASAQSKLFLREHDDAAAFGRFVGERGELRGVGEAFVP